MEVAKLVKQGLVFGVKAHQRFQFRAVHDLRHGIPNRGSIRKQAFHNGFFLIGQGAGFHRGGGLRVAIQNINGGGLVIQIIVCAIIAPTINIKEATAIKVHLSVMRGVLHIVNSRRSA